jgi:hypothetical protein
MCAIAPAAMSAGTLSAAGEALHTLPPTVARPFTWIEPMSFTASATPGHALAKASCSTSSIALVAAPKRNAPSSVVTVVISGMCFTSTSNSGWTRPERICTSRSVAPASTRAWPFAAASSATAAETLFGAS